MNNTDYDKEKFDSDKYGHLTPKQDTTHYKGHKIDIGIGKVKVWAEQENGIVDGFVGEFPDVATAKEHIDTK